MSLGALARETQSRLASAESEVLSALIGISAQELVKFDEFIKRFKGPTLDAVSADLDKFTISQLNAKGERVRANINHLGRLSAAYSSIQEYELIISNPGKLLPDLKRLHTIVDTVERAADRNYSLTIYDNIHRWTVTAGELLASALNEALVKAVPTPYLISNIEQLHEICGLAQIWGIKLPHMKYLRSEWDSIASKVLSDTLTLVFDDSNLIDDSVAIVLGTDSSISAIQSITSLVEFINHTRIEAIKQFLSSKITTMLTASISANIGMIHGDPAKMKELKHLIELCSLTDWPVLKQLRGGLMQSNLNTMHLEWQIVSYISRARSLVGKGSITVKTPWVPSLVASNHDSKPVDAAEWDDGWDDNWDVQVDDEALDIPENDTETTQSILVSDLARELFALLLEYRDNVNSDTTKLTSSIRALLSTAYAGSPNPFSLYNDLIYLDETSHISSFGKSAEAHWKQCLVRYYSEVRAVISLLTFEPENANSSNDEVDDDGFDSWGQEDEEVFELSEYNMNQLGLLHLWFRHVFEESEMATSNHAKFEEFAVDIIDYVNTCFLKSVFALKDITGKQLKQIPALVDAVNNITVPLLGPLHKPKNDVGSYHQLENIKFLMNSSMKQIMDKFFAGDLFDIATDDLINIIKAIFVESDKRAGYLGEIIEFRNTF